MSLEPSPLLQGAGTLTVDLGLTRRWGILVAGSLSSPHTLERAPGQVAWRRNPLAFLWRISFTASPRHQLSILVGPFVDLIAAEASGFSSNRAEVTADPGLRGAFRWRAGLWRGLFSTVGVGADVLLRTTRLDVASIGTIATTPRAWASLDLGLGWQFF